MPLAEALQAPDQPLAGEDRRDGDREHAFAPPFGERQPGRDLGKAGAEIAQYLLPEGGRPQALRMALEQGPAELLLGLEDLLAHGADGDAELLGGGAQVAEAPGRLEGAQAVQVEAVEVSHIAFL